MPGMMPMFPPQFQPPQNTQGNQGQNDSAHISQHQMNSFFNFPENVNEIFWIIFVKFYHKGTKKERLKCSEMTRESG